MISTEPCPFCTDPVEAGTSLRKSKDILACLQHFRDKKQEYFVCLSMDGEQRLLARRVVTIGILDTALAHPREIFAGPITDRAAAVIIAHNHPSGFAQPSKQDITTTQQLVAAGLLLGIPVRDHIIVATEAHFSFRSHRMI